MVIGFESFREAFKGYEDCYTIIGGTACDILLGEVNMEFRATKDVDMILIIENRFDEFGKVLWDYIKAGGYRCGWKGSENLRFFRFTEPGTPNYPSMIELFSRNPGYDLLDDSMVVFPLHVDDDVSSLSAILLNDDYYKFMIKGRRIVNEICVLDTGYIIPFKMKAWNDLTAKRKSGSHVNSKDIKKHKNDVFRLASIVSGEKVDCSENIRSDIKSFIESIPKDNLKLSDLGVKMEVEEAIDLFRMKYL